MASLSSNPIPFQFRNTRIGLRSSNSPHLVVFSNLSSSSDDASKSTLRISADSAPKARFVARRTESISVRQLQRPLILLVRVEEQPDGCCIKLLSCKLEGSPIVVAQNDKFDASMENKISCDSTKRDSPVQRLTSDAVIEVSIEIPFAFRAIPAQVIESTGSQVLEQILKAMLPRFMSQLVKDYQAWASGDTSRQPLGTGEI
ncbi:UNVERIFIED_CONTAM: hypothetical protein Slati_1182200 [Sesamum latifolium]|uniref:Uncharacterized protein n=1 Tax=Sesamum latifolium TaxID=2727402 RepID=A0AAW2XGM2_9LAMI